MADAPSPHNQIAQNIDSAYAYLEQGEPLANDDVPGLCGLSSIARSLFVQAKTDAQLLLMAEASQQGRQSLELLVHRSNVGMVYCLEMEAGAYYAAGFVNYDHDAETLEDEAKGNLELAIERLTQASKAYIEFEESFARMNNTEFRNSNMPILRSALCDAYSTLGGNAQKRAQLIITPLVEGIDVADEQLIRYLSYYDESFDWYVCVLGVYKEAAEIGVAPAPEFRAPAEEGLFITVVNVMQLALHKKEQLTKPNREKYIETMKTLGLAQEFELYFRAAVLSKN